MYAPFFHSGNTGPNPVAARIHFEVVPSSRRGSFEHVETPSRLKRLLWKKIGTEIRPRRPMTLGSSPTVDPREARLARWLLLPALGVIAAVVGFPLSGCCGSRCTSTTCACRGLGVPSSVLPTTGRPSPIRASARRSRTPSSSWPSASRWSSWRGFALALVMRHATRGRAALRVLVLLPWAIPTAASALVWRFLFDSQAGLVNEILIAVHALDAPRLWLVDPILAWLPIVAADVWKTTPFVALLLLAGLQGIDESLYDAARVDGAGPWRELVEITLPLLKPAIVVAVAFRALDAFRIFDLIYVLTGGGPGTATESISLYTFGTLLQNLRFGYASALSVIAFAATFALGLVYIHLTGRHLLRLDR